MLKRGGHRSRAIVLSNTILRELKESEPDVDKIESTIDELKRQYTTILELDKEIADKSTASDIEVEITEAPEKVMQINAIMTKRKKIT